MLDSEKIWPSSDTEDIVHHATERKPTQLMLTDSDGEPVLVSAFAIVVSRYKVFDVSPVKSLVRLDGVQAVLVRDTLEEIADQMGLSADVLDSLKPRADVSAENNGKRIQ